MLRPLASLLAALLVVPVLVAGPVGAMAPVTAAGVPGVDGLVQVQVVGAPVPGATRVVGDWWVLPAGALPVAAAAVRAAGGAVGPAEPVRSYRAVGTPVRVTAAAGDPIVAGDPSSDRQWHLAEVGVPAAWERSRGAGAVVAVLDSGITPGPDLACRTFVADHDATGATDPGAPVPDGSGHGTHVAGTIGQCSDNGLRTAGVAPDVALMDVKVLGGDPTQPDAGNGADLARGISFAARHGADVLNLSVSSPCGPDQPTWEQGCRDGLVDAAIAEAVAAGAVLVAAAGNDADDRIGYPGAHPDVLAVGALDASRLVAPYASTGAGLALSAPGGVDEDTDGDGFVDFVYQESYDPVADDHALFGMVGTSMAAPHVAGVLALLVAAAPDRPAADFVDALLRGACDLDTPGPDARVGAGTLRAGNALRVLLGGTEVPPCFRDVPLGSRFDADVAWAAARGVTRGCDPSPSTLFCPRDVLTRGQLAALLDRALDLAPARDVDPFVDDDGSPFEPSIARLVEAGMTGGCATDPPRFCPRDPVTRAQLAAMLVRALDLPPAPAGDPFVDDDGSPFEDDVEALAASGITGGCAEDPPRFCGTSPVQRQQLAAFLRRGLEGPGGA